MITMVIRTRDTAETVMQLSVCQYIYNAMRHEIRFRINPNGSTICLKCSSIHCDESALNIYLEATEQKELENKLWT